jgi:competence protein ComFC
MARALEQAGQWAEAVLGLLYPRVCCFCRERAASPDEGYVCEECRLRVRYIVPPFCQRCGLPFPGDLTTEFECSNCRGLELHFTSARSAVVAEGLVLEAIHRFKYQRQLWLEPFLAALLARQAGPALRDEGWNLLVPVPLHPLKQREREFNQAVRLAHGLSRATGLPVQGRAVLRVLPTQTQTRLTREQRAANVRRAFAAVPGIALGGARVVLVDDVFTTGATTSACALALRKAGAAEVCVWTVARGL